MTGASSRSVDDAIAAAVATPECLMVNHNAGSGTRILIDRLLRGAKPPGYCFIPAQDEYYDFVVPKTRIERPPVRRFRALLDDPRFGKRWLRLATGSEADQSRRASTPWHRGSPLAQW